jgi:hypothetical protein
MTKSNTTSRAPGERLAARQRRQAAALLKSAHAGMALWRECKRKDCRRQQACAHDVDQCGLRCAPKAWAWVQHAVAALAAGASRHAAIRAAEKAVPRTSEAIVLRWPDGVFDDVVWLRKDDGSMERVDGPLPPAPWALQLRRLVSRPGGWLRGPRHPARRAPPSSSRQKRLWRPMRPRAGMRTLFSSSATAWPITCAVRP